jgi:molybdopterin-guanine dinucleotide biosynthesis protein A
MKHISEHEHRSIPVVILAGGQSNRLQVGNNLKWQLPFNCRYSSNGNNPLADSLAKPSSNAKAPNQTLLGFIIERLKSQTNCIMINGPYTENLALAEYQLPIIADLLPDFQGPLSGILTALNWAKEQGIPWVATVSCDTPFFPEHLLDTLSNALFDDHQNHKQAAIAVYKERTHPTFGLWAVELYESLKYAIEVDKVRAVNRWALGHAKKVEFGASVGLGASAELRASAGLRASAKLRASSKATINSDPFFNINTPHDYKEALSYLT